MLQTAARRGTLYPRASCRPPDGEVGAQVWVRGWAGDAKAWKEIQGSASCELHNFA